MRTSTLILSVALAVISTVTSAAEVEAGRVAYIGGALVAQRADGTVKVLAPKSEVYAGDMLITA
ncbi:MAG: hypothetical protein ABI479_01565, partial [Gallionella sp.]